VILSDSGLIQFLIIHTEAHLLGTRVMGDDNWANIGFLRLTAINVGVAAIFEFFGELEAMLDSIGTPWQLAYFLFKIGDA